MARLTYLFLIFIKIIIYGTNTDNINLMKYFLLNIYHDPPTAGFIGFGFGIRNVVILSGHVKQEVFEESVQV